MHAYIAYMNRKDIKTAAKLLLCCTGIFFTLAAAAYANTRYNGFADVPPADYYLEKLWWLWERICECLLLYPRRFINFFN